MKAKERIHYLDNLKVFLIILVIIHHVGQAYGINAESWFYSYPGEHVEALSLFFLFNASFFMGLFFFISGYFFPESFDQHRSRHFINSKLIRFGIPLIFACLIMVPILEYVKYLHYVNNISFKDFYIQHWFGYAPNTAAHNPAFNFAHMWYVEHLLVYSILYVVIKILIQKCIPSMSISKTWQARTYVIIPYILVLGFSTNIMRTSWDFPIDKWIGFLGFIQMEPAHIPQYLSLFIIGVLAYRWSFLESLTTPRNMFWFVPGIGVCVVSIIILLNSGNERAFLSWEYKEALLCVGVCIGLLSLFKTYFNRTGRIMQILSKNSYGTYILHVPVVVILQYAFDPVQVGAFPLFIIVSLLSIPGSFLASFLAQLIPGVKRII